MKINKIRNKPTTRKEALSIIRRAIIKRGGKYGFSFSTQMQNGKPSTTAWVIYYDKKGRKSELRVTDHRAPYFGYNDVPEWKWTTQSYLEFRRWWMNF